MELERDILRPFPPSSVTDKFVPKDGLRLVDEEQIRNPLGI